MGIFQVEKAEIEPYRIDTSYIRIRRHEGDHIDEHKIDALRKDLKTRDPVEKQRKRPRYGSKSKKSLGTNQVKQLQYQSTQQNILKALEQAKHSFNSIQTAHLHENGKFIKAKSIATDRLPEI